MALRKWRFQRFFGVGVGVNRVPKNKGVGWTKCSIDSNHRLQCKTVTPTRITTLDYDCDSL